MTDSVLLIRALKYLYRKGPIDAIVKTRFVIRGIYMQRWLKIDSDSTNHTEQLWDDPDINNYEPLNYRTIDLIFRLISIRRGKDVFIDYGCGLGRVLLHAATHDFKKVIGIEISSTCYEVLESNIQRAKLIKCRNIETFWMDARNYSLPDDATILFFFNPFKGRVLEAVIQRIGQSLKNNPRTLQLVYVYPLDLEDIFAQFPWLQMQSDQVSEGVRVRLYKTVQPAAV